MSCQPQRHYITSISARERGAQSMAQVRLHETVVCKAIPRPPFLKSSEHTLIPSHLVIFPAPSTSREVGRCNLEGSPGKTKRQPGAGITRRSGLHSKRRWGGASWPIELRAWRLMKESETVASLIWYSVCNSGKVSRYRWAVISCREND